MTKKLVNFWLKMFWDMLKMLYLVGVLFILPLLVAFGVGALIKEYAVLTAICIVVPSVYTYAFKDILRED